MKNQKTKTQKGITLVALVITIIVLLILAAVVIGAIQNKGIIKHAQNASSAYEEGDKKEQSALASLLDKIKEKDPGNRGTGNDNTQTGGEGNNGTGSEEEEEIIPSIPSGIWTNTGDGKIVSNNGDVLEIGVTKYTTQQVIEKLELTNVSGNYKGNWVVMGVEDQKIKLVSEDIVREQVILGHNKSPNGDNNYTMTMENSEDILNEIVQSETGIVSARSIKSSDIISENFVPKGSYWLAESCYYDVAIRIISGMTVEKGTGMKYINSAGELEYAHIYTDTINAGGYFGNVQYQSFKSSGACAVIVIYESSLIPDGPWTDNGDGTLTSSTGEIVEIGVTKYGTMQVLKTLGLKPTVGKYNGSWVVIGLDGTKLKLVSKENVGSNITIGYLDSTVNMDEIEEIYNSSNLNLEKAIWSYNHAIDTLNKAAQEQTGIITARSINIEDLESENVLNITEEVKKSSNKNYGRTFKYYYYSDYIYSENIEFDDPNVDDAEENWVERMPDSWNKVEAFVSPEKELIDSNNATRMLKFKCNAYEYGFTDEQKTKFDILLDSDIYWIGSRTISCSCWKNTSGGLGGGQSTINCDFQLYIVNEVGVSRKNIFSGTLKSNYSDSSTGTYGVRAVVSI